MIVVVVTAACVGNRYHSIDETIVESIRLGPVGIVGASVRIAHVEGTVRGAY